MTTSVIVVTYRTPPALLARCLASIKTNNLPPPIIVDNTAHNIGFAAAANVGAEKSTADLLLFLNPDAALSAGAYATAPRYLAQNLSCGIVGLLLVSERGLPEQSFGPSVTPLSLFTRHWRSQFLPPRPTTVGWVSGGALLIRRALFEQLHGFDPRFFLYWEDVDLCRRAREAGARVVVLPAATVTHQRGASLIDRAEKTRLFDQSADKYFRKYYATSICAGLRGARALYRLVSPLVD